MQADSHSLVSLCRCNRVEVTDLLRQRLLGIVPSSVISDHQWPLLRLVSFGVLLCAPIQIA